MWVQVAVEYGAGLADRGRRPRHGGDREPRFEQLRQRGRRADRPVGAYLGDQVGEAALRVGAVAAHCRGAVVAAAGLGLDAGVDAQLPRCDAALADRALHSPSIDATHRLSASGAVRVMGSLMGMMGKSHRCCSLPERDETPASLGFRVERTTGFEPASLTLAKKVRRRVHVVHTIR